MKAYVRGSVVMGGEGGDVNDPTTFPEPIVPPPPQDPPTPGPND
ncbi:hypothetical protein [Streptomyces sp. NPDC008265]